MIDELEDLRRIDLPFDLDKVDPQCHACVRAQLNKYEKAVDREGVPLKGRFTVPCRGIPIEKIDPLIESKVSIEQAEAIKAMNDPVLFAKKYIKDNKGQPWIARRHQEDVLRCTSKRKCLRISRRSGKTDLVVVDIIYRAFTNERLRILVIGPQKKHAQEIFNRVKEKIYANPFLSQSVETDVASPYSILKLNNKAEIRGFAGGTKGKGEGVAVRGEDADIIYLEEASYIDESSIQGAILPVLQTSDDVSICAFSTPSPSRTTTFFKFCKESPNYKEFHYTYKVLPWWKQIEEDSSMLTEEEFMSEYCLSGDTLVKTTNGPKKIKNISIFDKLYTNNSNELINVLKEGTLTRKKSEVINIKTWSSDIKCTPDHKFKNIKTRSKESAKEIKELFYSASREKYSSDDKNCIVARLIGYLNGDGAIGKINYTYKRKRPNKDGYYPTDKKCIGYRSCFDSKDKSDIEFILKELKELFPELNCNVMKKKAKKGFEDTWQISVSTNISKFFVERGGLIGKKIEQENDVPKWIQENDYYMREYIAALFGAEGSTIRDDGLYSFGTISLSMSKIPEIKDNQLYTIHSYLNKIGIETSISEKIVTTKFKTQRKITCLYILGTHDNIKRFEEKIGYRYCWEKEVKLFKYIKYIDYYNYLTQKQDSILSFCRENKNNFTLKELGKMFSINHGSLWSLLNYNYKPGQRQRLSRALIKNSMKIKDWINFYSFDDYVFEPILSKEKIGNQDVYNITVNSDDNSYLLADDVVTFNCAEFPETGGGVYRPSYIDRALIDYKYENMRRNPIWKYTMGVDWNEKHGAEIVILGYDPINQMHQVVEALNVTGTEFTQLASVDKVIQMNTKWKPSFVFVDAGNGSSNHELLMKTAYDAIGKPDLIDTARLKDILSKYDSGAAIEVQDAITHERVKKPAKSFMVNSSVRLFERNKIRISIHDHILKPQLENYIIERITPSGNPVYGLEKESVLDHRLDALNLAIVAFQLNFDVLYKKELNYMVAAAPDPRTCSINRDGSLEIKVQRPEPRDFGNKFMSVSEMEAAIAVPGRIDLKRTKTTRPGWDTDEEAERTIEMMQRKSARQRSNFRNNYTRPRRENI